MRTRHQAPLAILLALSAFIAASCDTGPGPSTRSQGRPSSDALPTPVATAAVSPSPQATPVGVLAADVLEANTTPWPVKAVRARSGICAIGEDDRLLCWGDDSGAPPDGAFTDVDPNAEGPCAIRDDGSIACWHTARTKPPKGTFTALASGGGSRCAIRTNGALACWPAYEHEDLTVTTPPGGSFVQVSLTEFSPPCALRDDGAIVCWDSEMGSARTIDGPFVSLGDGCGVRDTGQLDCFMPTSNESAPLLPEGTFTTISGGPDAGCAIRSTGTLACWGRQGYDPMTDDQLPMRAPTGTYVAVSVSEYTACALRPDGHAVCWGADDERSRPAPPTTLDVPEFSASAGIEATWHATPLMAPITGYDVEYAHRPSSTEDAQAPDEDEPPAWTSWHAGTTETSATLDTAEGGAYCFRARAHDADGVIGAWREAGCTVVPLDDRDLEVSGDWSRVDGDAYFRHTASRSLTKGASIRIDTGSVASVAILGTTCGGCGSFVLRYVGAECEPDDESSPAPAVCPAAEEEVDLKGPRDDSVIVVGSNAGQAGMRGPIEIVVTSTGKPVIIDGIYFNLDVE